MPPFYCGCAFHRLRPASARFETTPFAPTDRTSSRSRSSASSRNPVSTRLRDRGRSVVAPLEQFEFDRLAHPIIARRARMDSVAAVELRDKQIWIGRLAHHLVEIDHGVEP